MNDYRQLIEEINKLKRDKNAIILVHNYQREENYEVADFIGDSLELSRKAKETDAKIIVFAGVKFMAETAKILSPEKKVLLPRSDAGCPMADTVSKEEILFLKRQYPDAAMVAYVNTTAETKAVVDICCTSSNAIEVVRSLPEKRIIFVPDKNLGSWIQYNLPEKEIILYDGYCYVHNKFTLEMVKKARNIVPDGLLIVHPECPLEVSLNADVVASTSGMVRYVKESASKKFIVGTEYGLISRLRRENPEKEFYSLGSARICYNMKKTTLRDILNSLKTETPEIKLDPIVIDKARHPLEEMLKIIGR